MADEYFEYFIAATDFDSSLLPPNARQPGTEAFKTAVSQYLQKQYEKFGGWARIRVDDQLIHVQWKSGPDTPDPVELALKFLRSGNYVNGVPLLESLLLQQPDNVVVLYNLGMALSDLGRLEEARRHLLHVLDLEPDHGNARVALGVAYAREQRLPDAIQALTEAVTSDPKNPWAHRNLGACLLKTGEGEQAEKHLRRATELNPSDPQAWVGLAQVLQALEKLKEADDAYLKVVGLDPHGPFGEMARTERSAIAQESMRSRVGGGIRPDAVMYCLSALQKFERMPASEVQKISFEIALLGRSGLDVNDSNQKYALRSLPGKFSGLHLVCLMYVGFKQIAPEHSIGFDLSKDYQAALALFKPKKQT